MAYSMSNNPSFNPHRMRRHGWRTKGPEMSFHNNIEPGRRLNNFGPKSQLVSDRAIQARRQRKLKVTLPELKFMED